MDNILLWSGLSLSGVALMTAAVYFAVYRFKGARLEKALDKEYGERKKPSGK